MADRTVDSTPNSPAQNTIDSTVQLVLHYDGARFHGWQRQPAGRTVQGELEAIFERLFGVPTSVVGAGRTDAGVHARGQAAHVLIPAKWTCDALRRAVNALAPDDLWVAKVFPMVDGFHARYSATARAYSYLLGTDEEAESPFRNRYEWHVKYPLDPALLHQAAELVVGEHVFRGFAVRGTAPEHDDHRCAVTTCRWEPRTDAAGFRLVIEANRFLHHMVRFLVGTMVDVALGRRTLASMQALLAASGNHEASPPAPARALVLERVTYPAESYAVHLSL